MSIGKVYKYMGRFCLEAFAPIAFTAGSLVPPRCLEREEKYFPLPTGERVRVRGGRPDANALTAILSVKGRENRPLPLIKTLQWLDRSLWPPPCNHLFSTKIFSVIHYLAGNLNGDIS
jgi:hypothetical protein